MKRGEDTSKLDESQGKKELAANYADYANGAQKTILDAPHSRNRRNSRLILFYGSQFFFDCSSCSKNLAMAVMDDFQFRHSSESWTSSGRTSSSILTPFSSSRLRRSTV